MKPQNRSPLIVLGVLSLVCLSGVLAFSVASNRLTLPHLLGSITGTAAVTTRPSPWDSLLAKIPNAYTTPLPPPVASQLDGSYAKVDPSPPQWWSCRRCADYRPSGGMWRLQFDRGVMRIFYEVTGWYSIASFTTDGDRLKVFNDPYCPEEVGEYTWRLNDGTLSLASVQDNCSFRLRGRNLGGQSWSLCELFDNPIQANPGNLPPGCEDPSPPEFVAGQADIPITVEVFGGDSRFFEKPPDVVAYANDSDSPSPDGIQIAYHGETIAYGLQRVLWWDGNWIEVTTDLPFSSMGIQFFGDPQIGWARLLFDGAEVWRGNTSEIWSKYGRHGGYLQVSGFPPGRHTLRAESLGFDFRPVAVASFGFSYQDGVIQESPD